MEGIFPCSRPSSTNDLRCQLRRVLLYLLQPDRGNCERCILPCKERKVGGCYVSEDFRFDANTITDFNNLNSSTSKIVDVHQQSSSAKYCRTYLLAPKRSHIWLRAWLIWSSCVSYPLLLLCAILHGEVLLPGHHSEREAWFSRNSIEFTILFSFPQIPSTLSPPYWSVHHHFDSSFHGDFQDHIHFQAKPESAQLILKLTLMFHDIAIYETAFPSPIPATWFWLSYVLCLES